jgi:GntR family transcriptional regulator, transcriptional repressor for pyruvate dehydrogenase complex
MARTEPTRSRLGAGNREGGTLASRVADSLIAFILEEGLKKGNLLPATADLAERYGVSRTVVREAIADLAGRGILVRSQGKESIVASPGKPQLHGLFQFRVLHDGLSAEEVLETRRALESMTARLAAQRRHPEDLSALKTALDDVHTARDDIEFHDADVRFHHLLAVASGNRLIVLIFEGFESLVRELRIRATVGRRSRGEGFETVFRAHRAIFDAVTARDPNAAESAMLKHLRQTEESLKALKDWKPGEPLGPGPTLWKRLKTTERANRRKHA